MEDRKRALLQIVSEQQPMTVRQVFYQATVRDIIEKTEAGYGKVQRALVDLRRTGRLPFGWISDSTRWQRKPETYNCPKEALRATARFYRKALWAEQDVYVEIWIEKDALASVIYDVTAQYDVPLMVARGYASLSFLHEAGEHINQLERPAYIYHLGDFDPSGVDAANKIEDALHEFAPDAEIHFKRLAVLPRQIIDWSLPTRPTKASDSRAKNFGRQSVELDAIPPGQLREMVDSAILQHIGPELDALRAAEASEREMVQAWADAVRDGESPGQ